MNRTKSDAEAQSIPELDAEKTNKALSILGFAMRARRLELCTEQVLNSVRKHGNTEKKAFGVVLCASDNSANTDKRIINSCKYYNVECYRMQIGSNELALKMGKGASVSSVAIFDAGFVKAIRKIINN